MTMIRVIVALTVGAQNLMAVRSSGNLVVELIGTLSSHIT